MGITYTEQINQKGDNIPQLIKLIKRYRRINTVKLRRDITPMIQILEHILKGMHTLDFSYSYEYIEGYCLEDTINEVKIYIEPQNNNIRLSRYYKGITLDWKPSSLKSLIFQLNVIDNEL